MRGLGAYAIAAAMAFSILSCANPALASGATSLPTDTTAAIGTATAGNDLSFIDIGGFLRLLGGFLRVGITGPSSGGGASSNNTVCQGSGNNPGTTDAYGTTWYRLCVGAGGFLTGIDIAPDDTVVVRTDTDGAYIWNGTQWQQLLTSTALPSNLVIPDSGSGVSEITIAPSNSNILYMQYGGYILVSTNKGSSWTETGFTQVAAPVIDGNNIYRFWGQFMAVDPDNSGVVVAGTPQNGLFMTTNGGTSWQQVSTVGTTTITDGQGDSASFDGIQFDPELGVSGGKTQTIFAARPGTGVYESTNAGSTWASIGGPTDVISSAVSPSTGIYYVVDNSNDLWSFQSGTWTELLTLSDGMEAVTVNPADGNEIVVADGNGYVDVSYNGGTTWSGVDYSLQLSATDVPWLADTGPFMDISAIQFDQQNPDKIWASDGVGVWNTSNVATSGFTSSQLVTWNDQSTGIEQLVANNILVPPGGNPVAESWDRAFFYISDPDQFPSYYSPVMSDNIVAGWSIDYASSNPNFLVGIADNWGSGNEESGYSTNGGQTWSYFPTFIPGADSTFIGGTIAASTPTNIIWAPADGYDPYYTTDGGNTWNAITLPGVSSWTGFDFAYYLNARTVTADRVLANTFYLYDDGNGVYKTTNGGASWTQVFSGSISSGANFNAKIESVPGIAGDLFFTGGEQGTGETEVSEPFEHSTDGGATWNAVPNVHEVYAFGFGKAASGTTTPAIYIAAWVNHVYGIFESDDDANTWTQIGQYPLGSIDGISTISGDMNAYGRVYIGFFGNGYAYGNTANAQIPPFITNISSGTPTTTSATITWTTDQSSNSEVVYGTTTGYGSSSSNGSLVTSHSITLSGLSSGTTYHYEVVSADSQGYAATSTDQTFTTYNSTPPSVPTGLTATATSSTEIDLSWNASTGDGTYPVAGYQIFRNSTQVGTTTSGTTYADTGLAASTTYSYTVDAYDTEGNVSAQTGSVSTSTQAGVTFTPTADPAFQYLGFATHTATFSGVNIGTASSNRVVVVGVANGNSGECPITSLTISGISATDAVGTQNTADIWYATIPTSTSATITLNCNAPNAFGLLDIAVGTITGASSAAPTATSSHPSDNTQNPQVIPTSGTITVPTNGASVIVGTGQPSCTPPTWTNTTSASGDYAVSTTTQDTLALLLAHSYTAGAQSYSVEGPGGTYGGCSFGGFTGAVAAWGP